MRNDLPFDPIIIFRDEVVPQIHQLEEKRRKAKLKKTIYIVTAIIAAAAVYYFLARTLSSKHTFFKFMIPALIGICALPFTRFREDRKQELIPLLLRHSGNPELIYTPKGNLAEHQLQKLGGWPYKSTIYSEDGLSGTRDRARFWFNEIRVTVMSWSPFKDENTVFRGWLLRIDLPDPHPSPVEAQYRFDAYGNIQDLTILTGTLNATEVDLFKSAIMPAAALVKLSSGFPVSSPIKAALSGRRFVLMIPTAHNLFESVTAPDRVLMPEAFVQLAKELHTLVQTVDAFIAAFAHRRTDHQTACHSS